MQQLLPYLLGAEHPAGRRLVDVQPCVRSQDIAEVGDNRHTTFFEMLGNWSIGDYSKAVQLPLFWHFLTEVVGLDPERIYVSVFSGDSRNGIPRDDESADIWTELFRAAGISDDRIELGTEARGNEIGNRGARIAGYAEKNWWSRFGGWENMPIGDPAGPDSEVFYFFPQVRHDPAHGRCSHQNSDGGQFLEIGNSVFMQYQRTARGFDRLAHHNVDFGGGLERIAAASIDSPDVYRVSVLWPIVAELERLSGMSYEDRTMAMRVITDHVRGAVFLAADGVRPSNKEQGYVLRRLLRRAMRFALDLDLTAGVVELLIPVVVAIYRDVYPAVAEQEREIVAVLAREEKAFGRTLRKGLGQLRRRGRTQSEVTGRDLFELHDTFGMPVELSTEEATRNGIALGATWRHDFDVLMSEQRMRSQGATAGR